MTRVIGVVSGKGGVGKTTLVANLGAALASIYKKDVIVVDCNVTTSHLGMYLGMYYYPISLNKVLSNQVKIDSAIYDYSINGMRIIPASLSLDDMRGIDISRLNQAIKGLFGKADIVLLDSAPGLGREAMSAMRAADEILYVMTPFVPSMMDIIKCNAVANELNLKPLGVVMNMTGEGRYELTPEEVEQLVELPVISRIPRDKTVLRSLAAKLPVIDFDLNSAASQEIIRLAATLIGEEYKPRGRMSRLLRGLIGSPKARGGFDFKKGVTWEDVEKKYI
jgi:septum site-determining protein MinD